MEVFKKFLSSPPYILCAFLLITILAILAINGFHLPVYYLDKDEAWKFLEALPRGINEFEAMKNFINPKYAISNFLFKLLAWQIAILFFMLILKIKTWKDIKSIPIIKNKNFIYLWTNFIYIPLAASFIFSSMFDLEKEVYRSTQDSMGIPLFFLISFFHMIALLYYPLMNLLFFITFNTKISNKFYSFLHILGIMTTFIVIIGTQFGIFSWTFVFDNICFIIWIYLFVSALRYLKEKRATKNLPIKELQ